MIHRWDLPGMQRGSKAVAVEVMKIDRGTDDGLSMILPVAVIPELREWHSSSESQHQNRQHSTSILPLLVALHFRRWAKWDLAQRSAVGSCSFRSDLLPRLLVQN